MELNDVIQALSVIGKNQPLPQEALAEAARLKDSITPVLIDAVNKVYEKINSSDETVFDDSEYSISFYAFFLLAQFREQSIFPKFLQILGFDKEKLEYMLGDILDHMGSILYSTYNGDLAAVNAIVADDSLEPFARGAALQLLDGLLRDGRLSKEAFTVFLRECLAALGDTENEAIFGAQIAQAVSDNDLYELAEDVRETFRLEKIDEMFMGAFDSFFDYLYNDDKYAVHPKIIEDTAQELKGWACFKSDTPSIDDILKWKVGRNELCPCGSGKKFKKCCLPKQEKLLLSAPKDDWEIPWDNYPSVQRQGNRPGLEDFYDKDAITVDRLAYQGMHWCYYHPPLWKRLSYSEKRHIEDDAQNFLWEAFEEFQKICQRDGLKSPEAYDRDYKLHYYCEDWLKALQDLLKERGDERYKEVEAVLSR